MKKYYTLAVREDGQWAPQLGDYDKDCVEMERDDMCDGFDGPKKRDTKVICTGDSQADVNTGIAKLNGEVR